MAPSPPTSSTRSPSPTPAPRSSPPYEHGNAGPGRVGTRPMVSGAGRAWTDLGSAGSVAERSDSRTAGAWVAREATDHVEPLSDSEQFDTLRVRVSARPGRHSV